MNMPHNALEMAWTWPGEVMPTISIFYGILIQMFWADHAPAHFHALYSEYEAQIDIKTLKIIKGELPNRRTGSRA